MSRLFPARVRGFTLIEMLVVLFIIVLITSIVITGQSNYNKTLLLTDTTYGVALSAREAQTFGLASRRYGNVQNPGYGLHFDNGLPSQYKLFADIDNTLIPPTDPLNPCPVTTFNAGLPPNSGNLFKQGNCRYDAADGVVSTYTFSRGFTVSQFCAKQGSGSNVPLQCSSSGVPLLTTLDLVFTRPNTTTTISGSLNGSPTPTSFTCAQVTIADATKQAFRTIRFSSIGEISINQTCP